MPMLLLVLLLNLIVLLMMLDSIVDSFQNDADDDADNPHSLIMTIFIMRLTHSGADNAVDT